MNAAEKQFSKYFKTMQKLEAEFAALNSHPDVFANWDVLKDILRTQFNRLKQYGDNAYEMSTAQISRIEEILVTAEKALAKKHEEAAQDTEVNEIVAVIEETELQETAVTITPLDNIRIMGKTTRGNRIEITVTKDVRWFNLKSNVGQVATRITIADIKNFVQSVMEQADYNSDFEFDRQRIDFEMSLDEPDDMPDDFEDLYDWANGNG